MSEITKNHPAHGPANQCQLCYIVGKVWAEQFLNTPGQVHGDIVWFAAEATEAATRTDAVRALRGTDQEAKHSASFVAGAVDFYEAAYQTASLGFPMEPEPMHGFLGVMDGAVGGILKNEPEVSIG